MKTITITNQTSGDSFEFVQDPSVGKIITSLEGWEYPTVISNFEDIPGRSGSYYVNSKFGRRRMSIQGLLRGDCYQKRRDLLAAINQDSTLKLIEFTTLDDVDLRIEAEVISYSQPYSSLTQPLLLELVAPDWRFESQVLFEQSTQVTQSGGGTALPTPIPISFSGAPGNPPLDITVGGAIEAQPTFIIRGPGTDFTVQNITTGESFSLNTTLASTDTVTINTKTKTVLLNGTTNVFGFFSGTFFNLPVGLNTISFGAVSGSTTATLLRIQYRESYLGV